MYSHMVHVERQGLQDWNIAVQLPGERRTAHTYYNSPHVKVDAYLEETGHEGMETWYCRDEASANALAKHLAVNLPGRNINVYALKSVARTAPTAPVLTEYSEKGLVP